MAPAWDRFIDFTKSLRFRLTVWNSSVVFVTVGIALIAVRQGLHYYLLTEMEDVLHDQAKEIALTIQDFYPDQAQIIKLLEQKDETHQNLGWHIRWLDADGKTTIWSSKLAPPFPLTKLVDETKEYRVYKSNEHRTIERELEVPGIPKFRIRVGSLTHFIQDDVDRLTNVLAPVAIAILLLAPIGGLLLAERAIEPLSRLIRTTERLRPSRLEERLGLRGAGDELDQLAGKINAFLDQIAEHLKKNRDFVANAAHDLRSPLAAIQSLVEVTVEKPRSVEEYEDLLFQINDETHHLGQLVNQLLQLAESESVTIETPTQPIRLSEIVVRTIEMFEPVADERGVKLKFRENADIVVAGFSGPLRQVLTNLVDNAIKFTEIGGVVTVTLDYDERPGYGRLAVSDTGVGIPPESVNRVFDRFYQVEKSRARFGEKRGNGLGLSICQSIVNSLHGGIKVQSELGKGTTFTVLLPLAKPESVSDA